MPVQGLLRKHELVIHSDLEDPPGRGKHDHLRARDAPLNIGRQTGGPRFVVSNNAVFDRDLHA